MYDPLEEVSSLRKFSSLLKKYPSCVLCEMGDGAT